MDCVIKHLKAKKKNIEAELSRLESDLVIHKNHGSDSKVANNLSELAKKKRTELKGFDKALMLLLSA